MLQREKEIENSCKLLKSFLKKKKAKDVNSDDCNEGSSADIVEETNSSSQKTSTSLVPKENEGEQEYGNMNPGEEMCEKKIKSVPKNKHLLALWHHKILLKKLFHLLNKRTHCSCQEGMKENISMAVRI
jgi:hypothetical protein